MYFNLPGVDEHATKELAPLYSAPAPHRYLFMVVAKAVEKIRWMLHNTLNLRQWSLMFHHGDDPFTPPEAYTLIQPPKDRLWADPFPLAHNNRHFVYFEDMLYSQNKGRIAVMEIDAEGNNTDPQIVLETDFHLSYPFVFEHDDHIWMIPESNEDNTLSLYRCTTIPDQWEFVMKLMTDIKVVDATLHRHEGRWWLFANSAAHDSLSKHDELHLYYADDFRTTQWTPHPLNPIISDVTNARPAGKLFLHNNKLYRPAQNCSQHYGYGYNLNEVHSLTTSEYHETCVKRYTPHWNRNIVAAHSLNADSGLSLIDAMVVRPRYY